MAHTDQTVELLIGVINDDRARIRALEEAVTALQVKVGVNDSEDESSVDYRLAALTEITDEHAVMIQTLEKLALNRLPELETIGDSNE